MRVAYKGTDPDFNYRVAEISWDSDNQREQAKVERTIYLMTELGWQIDTVCDGYASCEVDDYDDYRSFMEDWKKCKRKQREVTV